MPRAAGGGSSSVLRGRPAAGKSTLAAALREALNGGRGAGKESEAGGEDKEGKAGEGRGHRGTRRLPLRRPGAPPPRAPAPEGRAVHLRCGGATRRCSNVSRRLPARRSPFRCFDRDLELSRAAAAVIAPHHRIVITEGNYLLLAGEQWRAVRDRLDFSVFLDVPAEELRRRLMARWLGHGYGPAEAKEKTEANDLVNARLVMETSVEPDLRLRLRAPG